MQGGRLSHGQFPVALRKESVDRNCHSLNLPSSPIDVALRKESVDRNITRGQLPTPEPPSLSARRAWIEIDAPSSAPYAELVALRKESVDRNHSPAAAAALWSVALRKESVDRNSLICLSFSLNCSSLSARRAWIEIVLRPDRRVHGFGRSPQGERG